MKISIYQVRLSQDTLNVAFRDMATVQDRFGGIIPSECYDRVYTGEVEAHTLEDIFAIFNLHHPVGYRGRSLTQSDIVEMHSDMYGSRFYFCDTYSFVPVKFDSDKCREGNGR